MPVRDVTPLVSIISISSRVRRPERSGDVYAAVLDHGVRDTGGFAAYLEARGIRL